MEFWSSIVEIGDRSMTGAIPNRRLLALARHDQELFVRFVREFEYVGTCWRTSRVVLNESDEVAYSRVLREFCPQTRIFDGHYDAALPNIAHASGAARLNIVMPSPGQEQTWIAPTSYDEIHHKLICRFTYERSTWAWYFPDRAEQSDPPHMTPGEFVAMFPCGNVEMQKFAMKVLRLIRKVTWKNKYFGLAASRWSQMGGPVRRTVSGGKPIPPEADIRLNKYYDNSLWDDQLPDLPTMRGHEYLEWHRLPVRRPALDPNER
jgi:hypothetical protein